MLHFHKIGIILSLTLSWKFCISYVNSFSTCTIHLRNNNPRIFWYKLLTGYNPSLGTQVSGSAGGTLNSKMLKVLFNLNNSVIPESSQAPTAKKTHFILKRASGFITAWSLFTVIIIGIYLQKAQRQLTFPENRDIYQVWCHTSQLNLSHNTWSS